MLSMSPSPIHCSRRVIRLSIVPFVLSALALSVSPAYANSVRNMLASRNPGSYRRTLICDGHGATLVNQCAGAPPLSLWKGGTPVKGNDIRPGTAIATFDGNGYYQDSSASGHTAIYDSQDQRGIWVWDQRAGQPVQRRYIRFKNGIGSPGNDGDAYSVIGQ